MTIYEEEYDDVEMTVGIYEQTVVLGLADETTLTVYLTPDRAMDVIGAIQEALQEVDQ